WSWKRQLDPATAAPYAAFLYDIKNAEAFNKKQIADRNQVGVRAKGDFLLEVTLEGPRAYFPVLCAYLAALPGHRPSIEKHGDKWTVAPAIDGWNVVKVAWGFAVPAHAMIPPGVPGSLDDPKLKPIQRFDPKLAMEQLKGTPYERGRNWPKVTLSMREQALGSKPLAE